ncbi:MAG: FAD-dependent oxidoreductase [Spirochaeta sp.]|jgi:NAD(P)H-nitrite reductase large subunit|nr:FAD-dependent oxidoreductase [Spirochaeta sp.]
MSGSYDVVVVGAGSAGYSAAAAARETNDASSILLINGEDRSPYDRTQLSKAIADRTQSPAPPLHPDEWFVEHRIERHDGVTVDAINRTTSTLSAGSQEITYGSLVLATGAEPLFPKLVRPHERGSFYVVRNARDAEELQARAEKAKTVLIAGMGVLAVEIAQQLAKMGKRITLAGATPQLMPRQLSARAGELLEEARTGGKHKLLFQEEIISFEKNKKHSWSVEMLKHSSHFDMVVFCIGVEARTGLATAANLPTDAGILVDDHLRTEEPNIFAAGDCAQMPDGRVSYLWSEAAAQGRFAGMNAAGADEAYSFREFPLWTNVFGLDLFSVGKPRKPWDYRIDEFEHGNRYTALYWSQDDILRGAIVLNDREIAAGLETAVAEGWTRDRVRDELSVG